MKALCWHGTGDVRVDTVPDPKIEDPRDAIVKITASGICGSDLHLLNGFMPTMKSGDVLGHEPMGDVVEVGSAVKNLKRGDRVVVPFTISCGSCYFCQKSLFSLLRQLEPQRRNRPQANGPFAGGVVWLLAHARRFCWRAGGIFARAVRRRRTAENRIGSARREGIVPFRHLSHRLHGSRELRNGNGRHRRRVGLRSCRRSSPFKAAGCSARDV